jgi:hypothetical protein
LLVHDDDGVSIRVPVGGNRESAHIDSPAIRLDNADPDHDDPSFRGVRKPEDVIVVGRFRDIGERT